jgi:hypothetical protein
MIAYVLLYEYIYSKFVHLEIQPRYQKNKNGVDTYETPFIFKLIFIENMPLQVSMITNRKSDIISKNLEDSPILNQFS